MSGTRRIATLAVALVTALVVIRVWPHETLRDRIALSTDVWSADGELLRVTRASDDQYRLWVPLSRMAPDVVEAFLLKEDRWFYWHPGVNPVALVRAAARTYAGSGRQGGSTLTMQLARLRGGLRTRTPGGKARQIVEAIWMEMRHSKHDILEAYLNVTPLGGNIQGVGAASHVYFQKSPDRLTVGEALTLAVIPQRPSTRAGRRASDASLLRARDQLVRDWLSRRAEPRSRITGAPDGTLDGADLVDLTALDERRQLELPLVARSASGMPKRALHFVDAIIAANPARTGRIETTLDADLQRVVERQLQRYLTQHGSKGIRNATALLVDARDMSVKAWVGSADYWNEHIDGQVNGVLAKRSPGSTLKPFVYALALDQGVLHPRTVLRDAPSSFGPFTPENFDGRFYGPITAQEALVRSRNIPAVWVAAQLAQPNLYQFLASAGVRRLEPEEFYGLALPLGGGELTMEELVTLYAMLANEGQLRPLRVTVDQPIAPGVRLLSPEAAFITLEMLRANPRPDADATVPTRTRWPVAWKTGTSWGFRDAWSAGVVGPYVLAVWIGDFRGQGNPAFIGTDAAAPLFFRIADAVNLARSTDPVPDSVPPPGATRIAVCAESGDLPNADCPRTADTWYLPGKSPIRVSQLHRAVGVDPRSGRAVCPPYAADTRIEVFEYWSSDMVKLFRRSGVPRRTPPALPDCAPAAASDAPRIASPLRGVGYGLRRSAAHETIPLEASAAADVQRLFWFDGNALIGSTSAAAGPLAWRPSTPGARTVRVVDDRGRSEARDVVVELGN